MALEELAREAAALVEPREVGDVLVDRRAAGGRARLVRRRAHAFGVATDERDLRAAPREVDRGRPADAARRTGEHHRRHPRDASEAGPSAGVVERRRRAAGLGALDVAAQEGAALVRRRAARRRLLAAGGGGIAVVERAPEPLVARP